MHPNVFIQNHDHEIQCKIGQISNGQLKARIRQLTKILHLKSIFELHGPYCVNRVNRESSLVFILYRKFQIRAIHYST